MTDYKLSAEKIKTAIAGRERELFIALAGIEPALLDGRGHACPSCGGRDRFNFNPDKGKVYCRDTDGRCTQHTPSGQNIFDAVMKKYGVDFPAALRQVAEYLGIKADAGVSLPKSVKSNTEPAKPIKQTEWIYRHSGGEPAYKISRMDFADNTKAIRQFRYENGQYIAGMNGTELLPFRLMELCEPENFHKTLCIAEGERCCDALQALSDAAGGNFIVTTASGGTNTKLRWSDFVDVLQPYNEIRLLPDNDRCGFSYISKVALELQKAGLGNRIKIVSLIDDRTRTGFDIADWIAEGGDYERLTAVVQDTPVWDGLPLVWDTVDDTAAAAAVDIPSCGVANLDGILKQIKPIDWKQYERPSRKEGGTEPPSEKDYLLRTNDKVLETAKRAGTPLINNNGVIYCYSGTHYAPITEGTMKTFLDFAACRCGVPADTARYLFFVEKIYKQFLLDTKRRVNPAEPETSFISLKNGVLFFDGRTALFEKHSPERFIRYCLDFAYDEDADCPLWQQHLDRSLPKVEKQAYLAKCLALPFYRGKIEKAPILYGQRDTGKSVSLDVYKSILGQENLVCESLAALTQADYHGDYARARLDGKLVNVSSDISKKIGDEGFAKILISREAVAARRPNQEGITMKNYARMVFALNEIPPQFFTDAALTKRAAIIEFDRQISPEEKDSDFAEKIINTELSGVLNWLIGGLKELQRTGKLDAPECCVDAMDKIRLENDPLAGWLDEKQYKAGDAGFITIKEAYGNFTEYCRDNGNQTPSSKTFARRLRESGFRVDCINHEIGTVLHYSPMPNFRSVHSVDTASPIF
jgi:putative DNA primase/helicase